MPATFDQVPVVVCNNFAAWHYLLAGAVVGAGARTIRCAIVGDSLTTAPGGNGNTYVPELTRQLNAHFAGGNNPESMLMSTGTSGGVNPGDADGPFLGLTLQSGDRTGSNAGIGTLTGIADTTKIPWGLWLIETQTQWRVTNWVLNPTGLAYGDSGATYCPNNADTQGPVQMRNVKPNGDAIWLDSFYYTFPGSADPEVWMASNTDGRVNMFTHHVAGSPFHPVVGLDSAVFAVKKASLPVPAAWGNAGDRYLCCGAQSATWNVKAIGVVGARFRNATQPGGHIVQSFSRGGMNMVQWCDPVFGLCANAQAMVAGIGPWDWVWLHCGLNDQGNLVTPATYKAQTLAVMAWWRALYPRIPIMLRAPIFRVDLVGEASGAQYAGALQEIVLADTTGPTMLLNTRRILDALGMNTANYAGLGWGISAPQVHPNVKGQRAIAAAEVAALADYLTGPSGRARAFAPFIGRLRA